jgi:hypothetical protein
VGVQVDQAGQKKQRPQVGDRRDVGRGFVRRPLDHGGDPTVSGHAQQRITLIARASALEGRQQAGANGEGR